MLNTFIPFQMIIGASKKHNLCTFQTGVQCTFACRLWSEWPHYKEFFWTRLLLWKGRNNDYVPRFWLSICWKTRFDGVCSIIQNKHGIPSRRHEDEVLKLKMSIFWGIIGGNNVAIAPGRVHCSQFRRRGGRDGRDSWWSQWARDSLGSFRVYESTSFLLLFSCINISECDI